MLVMIDKNAIPISMAEIGLVINIEGLPFDILRDCFREFSNRGERIKANVNGAPSKLVFLIM
jgi:hypothetical protein